MRSNVRGGLASGMHPSDFDPEDLRRGTLVEMEHTDDRRRAQKIAMDHLVEDARYYDKLAQMEATPNRVRVFDAEDDACRMRETFTAKAVKERVKFDFHWPTQMQHVGDSLAVAYSSDKWKDEGDIELYKHLAESRNVILCVPGFLRDGDRPDDEVETIGPMISFAQTPMPRDIAILALFEEADLQLHVDGTDDAPSLGAKDDGVVKVTVAHGHLGGGKMQDGRVFLVVFTERDGILMLILGDELDVLEDGIVG